MASQAVTVDLWNVGQGDCSTIKTEDDRLVVIDVGPRNSPLVSWLSDHPEITIDAIILTHNDADHAGALPSIVEFMGKARRIKTIYMLEDRSRDATSFQRLFKSVRDGHAQGFYDVFNLQIRAEPESLWKDESSNTELVLHFPDFIQNVGSKTPNTSSAILSLASGDQTVVLWPGDNLLETVCEFVDQNGAHVLMGPHHGAPQDKPLKPEFIAKIAPNYGFMSLGTTNGYGHPKAAYIRQLSATGIGIGCSQLTKQCTNSLNNGKAVLNTSALLGLWPCMAGTPCRDAMRIYVKDGLVQLDEWTDEHAKRVRKLKRPICLK